MTDAQQGLMQKKSDLKFYYKMAQEAFQADDVDQALKISKSGLEQAKLQNKGDWVNKFDSFNANISQQQSLRPSIKKETLTIVKGISPKVAEKLSKSGINSVSELVHASSIQLAKIDGIGQSTAQKIIDCAKEHLQTKKLNDFSVINNNIDESNKVLKSSQKEDKTRGEISKWFNGKFQRPETEIWYPPEKKIPEDETSINDFVNPINDIESAEREEIDEDDISFASNDIRVGIEPEEQVVIEKPEMDIDTSANNSIVISPELARQSILNLHEQNETSKEILTHSQLKELIIKISKELDQSDFVIIKETPAFRNQFSGIDLLAVKLVRVKEFLDLIYVIPIKISSLKGSFIVSSDSIEYPSLKNVSERNFHLDRLPKSYLRALSQARKIISSDIGHAGELVKYLSKYLNTDIKLERTKTRKNLFFRSGPVQYKILIEPVLICQNTVGFKEKIIPFAYQKNANIHIVEHSRFPDLLQYLEQKYFFIETYSIQKNALALNCEASNHFMKDLRKYSAPFMVYGFIVLLILLFREYSALPLLINLGYGIISFYFVVIGYIYLKLYRKKSELNREFSAPYHQRKLYFDETNLILINEELSPKLMEQFVYECIGKDAKFNIINKIEQDNAESLLSKKLNKKKIEDSHLFESETIHHSNNSNRSKDSKIKHNLIDKYSSFLED